MVQPAQDSQVMRMGSLTRQQFIYELTSKKGIVTFDTDSIFLPGLPKREDVENVLASGQVFVLLGKKKSGLAGEPLQAHVVLTVDGWDKLTVQNLSVRVLIKINWDSIPSYMLK